MRPRFTLDPSRLAHRLQVQRPEETTGASGDLEVHWVTVAHVWAALEPVRTVEEVRAQQHMEDELHDIICRFRTDIGSGWRFAKDGRTFAVIGVHDPDERKAYLICRTRSEAR